MVNIVQVFNTLKSMANEDQSGFITPSSFSDYAPVAQMNIYNEIMDNSDEAKKSHRASISSKRGTSNYNKSKTKQAFFLVKKEMTTSTNGLIPVPNDFSFFSSAFVSNSFTAISGDGQVGAPVHMMYDDPNERYRSSRPYSLTSSKEEGSLDYNAFFDSSDRIVIKNAAGVASQKGVTLNYYRVPGSIVKGEQSPLQPSLGVKYLPGNTERIESFESRHFDLPSSQFSEVVAEMAKLVGIQIEESMIYQYGQAEDSQPEKKNFD